MTFQTPPIAYRCVVCGDCCREPWALRLDEEARVRLEEIPWDSHRAGLPPGSEAELFGEAGFRCYREVNGRRVLARSESGCVFLEEGNTCFLHREFGAEMKPNACLEFPYSFVDTPDGAAVGLSFVCRAIRDEVVRMAEAGSGQKGSVEPPPESVFDDLPVASRRSEADPSRRRSLPDELRLQEGLPLAWGDYLLVEKGLDSILESPKRAWNDRLVAGEVYLGLMADYLRATGAADDPARRDEVLRHYVEKTVRGETERFFQIGAKIRPDRRIRGAVTGLFHAFAREAGKPSGKGRFEGGRLAGRWVWQMVRGFRQSRPLPVPDEVEGRILILYARHVIWRKGLLAGASPYFTGVVRRGYAHLLVTLALVLRQWADRMESLPRREALLDALRVVERDFVLHGSERREVPAQELINRHTFPLYVLDTVTHRKYFARSMVG